MVALIAIILVILLYLLNFVMCLKNMNLLKISTFESGFLSVGKIQSSFSIHFFIMMLMFVIFDLEIVMFLGLLMADFTAYLIFFLLLWFIVVGFYMEWWYGKLIWLV